MEGGGGGFFEERGDGHRAAIWGNLCDGEGIFPTLVDDFMRQYSLQWVRSF